MANQGKPIEIDVRIIETVKPQSAEMTPSQNGDARDPIYSLSSKEVKTYPVYFLRVEQYDQKNDMAVVRLLTAPSEEMVGRTVSGLTKSDIEFIVDISVHDAASRPELNSYEGKRTRVYAYSPELLKRVKRK